MIPHIIHYCWFGRAPLPADAQKCIDSWRRHMPDYKIVQWDEDNFDVNIIPYTEQAYKAANFAFVSDYARIWILYHHGGLYFDTDVEIIKPIDDIVATGAFMGYEIEPCNKKNINFAINPGLGIAATAGMDIYRQILDYYQNLDFYDATGNINRMAIVRITTHILNKNGIEAHNGIQTVAGITVYPPQYFNPLDSITGKLNITDQTRSIHWYTQSWIKQSRWRIWLSRMLHRLISAQPLHRIKNFLRLK